MDTLTSYLSSSFQADEADLKTPPHALEAEQSVVGGLMLENDQFDEVSAIVQADDFYVQSTPNLI